MITHLILHQPIISINGGHFLWMFLLLQTHDHPYTNMTGKTGLARMLLVWEIFVLQHTGGFLIPLKCPKEIFSLGWELNYQPEIINTRISSIKMIQHLFLAR